MKNLNVLTNILLLKQKKKIIYTKNLNVKIFKWFSCIVDNYIDTINLEQEELDYLKNCCIRCFRELFFLKILSFNNYITDTSLKILSYAIASLTLKHIGGYDWLLDEDCIISDLVGKNNNLITCKNIVDAEYDLLNDLLNLKTNKRMFK